MTVVALIIAGYLVFLLSGSRGFLKSKSTIYTYLGDSSDLAQGAPVRLNGIVVGKVSKVELSGSDEPGRVIKVDLEIQDEFMRAIPVDSSSKIASGNLLGTKYINITKGHSPQPIQRGGELQSASTAALEDVFQQGDTALAALEAILKKMDSILDSVQSGKGNLGKLLVDETLYDKLLAVTNEAQKLIATINSDRGTVGKLLNDNGQLYDELRDDVHTTFADVRGSLDRVNTLLDGLNQGEGTAGKFLKDPAMYDQLQATMGDVRKLLADLDAGKGTAGKLLKSDELHNQIQATIGRVDGILDKVNSGQGTLGQLLVNPQLYDEFSGTSRELRGLLQDFRKNPSKFLHVKIGLF
jgi:phospholipid/cholesterol/gamma-HCH transport system substrate-binding protein